MIATETIKKIKEVDIITIVEQFTQLSKQHKANCPLPNHSEKTPSFTVSAKKQTFHCYGCNESGDSIQFIMKMNNCDFVEAVERIAEIAGITIEYAGKVDKEAIVREREEVKALRSVLIETAAIYKNKLWQTTEGKTALDYLRNTRGFTDEVIRYWNFGYAGDNRRTLCEHFTRQGLLPQAEKTGVVSEGEKAFYDYFKNRITTPILNDRGEIVSFGGRVITDVKENKYINGRATTLYQKSKTLFGLYQAIKGIQKYGYAILVEGYYDVISMHSAGAVNTVGSCGTALTEDHCKLLKKYTNYVVIMRDGDTAGQQAFSRDVEMLLSNGFKVDNFLLTGGNDPDDFAKTFILESGSEAA